MSFTLKIKTWDWKLFTFSWLLFPNPSNSNTTRFRSQFFWFYLLALIFESSFNLKPESRTAWC